MIKKRAASYSVVAIFLLSMMNTSCNTCYSGMFSYDTKLKLVDEDGTPLAGIRVVVEDSDRYQVLSDVHCDCDDDYCRTTDSSGYAAVVSTCTKMKYSFCSPDKNPEPPPRPKKLYPWIEYPKDNWTMYEVKITDEKIIKEEPRSLTIDLGTITIYTGDDTDEFQDAGIDASL